MHHPTELDRPAGPPARSAQPQAPSACTPQSWDRLARTHGRVLRRMAYEVLRAHGARPDSAAVDDLVQDVFCRLLERPRGFASTTRCPRRQRAYLRRVTRSVAVDRRRAAEALKRGGDVRLLTGLTEAFGDAEEAPIPAPIDPRPSPEEQLLSCERWRLFVRRCLHAAGASPAARREVQVVVLAMVGGWTSRELAAASREGLSPATIDSLICRARRRLAGSGLALPRRGAVYE